MPDTLWKWPHMETRMFALLVGTGMATLSFGDGTIANMLNVMPSTEMGIQQMVYHDSSLQWCGPLGRQLAFTVSLPANGSYVKQPYSTPVDWSAYEGICFTVTNNAQATAKMQVVVTTLPPHQGPSGHVYVQANLEPGMSRAFVAWFTPGQTEYGFRQAIAEMPTAYQWVSA